MDLECFVAFVACNQNKEAYEELLATFCLRLRLDSDLDGEVCMVGHVGVIETALVHDILAG